VSMQLTSAAAVILAKALAEALAGGELRLCSGRVGGEGAILARLPFPEVDVSTDAVLRYGPFQMQKVQRTGDLTWFYAVGAGSDEILLTGVIGPPGVEKVDVPLVEPHVYEGMELTLQGFAYAVQLEAAR
jgi:hypothetical protein